MKGEGRLRLSNEPSGNSGERIPLGLETLGGSPSSVEGSSEQSPYPRGLVARRRTVRRQCTVIVTVVVPKVEPSDHDGAIRQIHHGAWPWW